MVAYFVCLGFAMLILFGIIFGIIVLINKSRNRKSGYKTLICGFVALILFIISMAVTLSWVYSYEKVSNSQALILLTVIIVLSVGAIVCALFGIIKPNKTKAGKTLCLLILIFEALYIAYATYSIINFHNNILPEKEQTQGLVSLG